MKAYAKTQDFAALIGNDSEILYQKDKKNVLRDAIKERGLDQENIYHTSGGYLICIPVEGTGWSSVRSLPMQIFWKTAVL